VQVDGEHVAEIGAEHYQDPLSDVDDVEHAEDQRQPDGHQRVDPAAEYPVDDGLVDLASHLSSVLLRRRAAQLDQCGFGLMIATEPVAPSGSTCTYFPFCHWKMKAIAFTFWPRELNCTGPWTLASVTPLCR